MFLVGYSVDLQDDCNECLVCASHSPEFSVLDCSAVHVESLDELVQYKFHLFQSLD